MWIPRIKVRLNNSAEIGFCNHNEYICLGKFKDKNLYYKFYDNNNLEFAIYGYENREDALLDGKILYFNVLFNGYRTFLNYSMGDFDYVKWYCHPKYFKCSEEEFYKNEEWFYCKKSGERDFLGLQIEWSESLENLDEYKNKNKISIELSAVYDTEIDFIRKMKKIDYECSYNETNQKIFNLFHLVENAKDDIKILLLCQILETMSENENKSNKAIELLNSFITELKNSDIDDTEKQSLENGINALKQISSSKKIKNLLEKYCKNDYKLFKKNKIVTDSYRLRSKIIHGEKISEEDDVETNVYFLKFVVLDTFKEWSKENK